MLTAIVKATILSGKEEKKGMGGNDGKGSGRKERSGFIFPTLSLGIFKQCFFSFFIFSSSRGERPTGCNSSRLETPLKF